MDLKRWLRSTALICLFITVLIHPSSSRYHGKRHKRQHGANLYLSQTYIIPDGEGDPSEWSEWSSPSECSRSCGGGVSYQTRECLQVGYNGEPLCKGGNKKFFSCNTQDCPEDEPDFRSQQCSRFNSVPFEGERYDWIPYTKAPNPCELNCMPRGERFYYRHKAKVIDGTHCNDESLDICVDGKCQPVGCDMMLGSDAREDKCRKCAGDGTSCQTINGTVDTNNLQVGYNDIFVIPAGATNIDIKEIEPSNNYLAARNMSGHYYLNGNWRIDFPRPMQFAGSWWHYDRKPQGFAAPDHISCMGPTTEAIVIVLLYQDRNVGVKYEYSVPEDSVKTNLDTYQWTHTGFGPCSASCGGGFQTREIYCNSRTTLDRVDDSLCDQSAKPSDTQHCGIDPCVPKWIEGEWGKCSKPCGEDGMQNRTVHCERITAAGVAEKVEDSVCLELAGNKPADKQECNRDTKNCPKYHLGPWKPCDKLCGEGKQTRKVTCYKEEDGKRKMLPDSECNVEKPEEEQTCILQPCEGVDWITSTWSGCTECGQTEETRTIKCSNKKGKEYDDNFCPKEKPDTTKPCEKVKKCDFQWYSSEWSKCSTLCGKGTQSRVVICGEFDGTSVTPAPDDSKCNSDLKPDSKQDCEIPEDKCAAQWFTGPWEECSKSCGGGTREREVICLENGEISLNCAEELVEFTSENCNTEACDDDEVLPVDSTATTISDDDYDEECIDEDDTDETDFDLDAGESSTIKVSEGIELDGETSTSISLMTDDLMMSDATGFETESTDDSTEIPLSTEEGSGDTTIEISTEEGSGGEEQTTQSTSDAETDTTEVSKESTESSSSTEKMFSTSDSASTEGSGSTDFTSSTDDTIVTTVSDSSSSTDSSDMTSTSDSSGMTTSEIVSGSTDLASEDSTTVSYITTDSSDLTKDTDSSDLTEETDSSDLTKETDSSTIASSTDNRISDFTDISSTTEAVTETTENDNPKADSDFIINLDSGTTSEKPIESTTDNLSSSLSTDSSSSETSFTPESSTDNTSESSTLSESTYSTDQQTTTSSDLTTESGTESSTPEEECEDDKKNNTSFTTISASETTEGNTSTDADSTSTGRSSETSEETTVSSDTGISQTTGETVDTTQTEDLTSTEESENTISTQSGELTTSATEVVSESTTSSGATDITETTSSGATDLTETTASGATELTETTSSEASDLTETTSSEATDLTETTSSGATELSETTTSGEIDLTETTTTGSTDASGITEISESTTSPEISVSTDEHSSDSTVSSASTDSSASTVSSIDETSMSGETTEQSGSTMSTVETSTSSDIDATTMDIWSSTGSDVTDDEDEKTTPNTLEMAITREHKPKKCKPRKKKDCKSSKFGCCPDNTTIAKGPFDEGCPISETCGETKFGCCPDGLSPAKGDNNEGCPKSQCAETFFGCCPDNYSTAEGEDNEGCPEPTTTIEPTTETPEETTVVDETTTVEVELGGRLDTCSSSKYGCCPDGSTEAQGENFMGCEAEGEETDCSKSAHGCCPDQKSPATGPNREGCSACATETFGCCPDGQTPAHGPYGEGCACVSSEFGCCPDNVNPARGPDNEGCECDYSPFGCCPDKKTPARGYGNEGCGCQCTEFGCCPDKLTVANAPKFKGCPCHTMQFGCCPDGITIPQGPHHHGCHCTQTEFKCCPDEKTPAKGPNQEGCTCAESKFGCCPDGITPAEGHKFEGCKTVPEAPQKACALQKETGPCNNFTIRHFFDTAYGACARFWYGGCEGNGNNFETADECKATCEEYKGKESCLLPRSPGPCPGNQKMWYFDSDRGQCEEFEYGGCFGNTNRFETLEECKSTCAVDESIPPCDQLVDKGPCDGNFERWYYDNETDVCRPFQYGGCQGNKNNYATENACVYHCRQPGVHKDFCKIEKEEGNCEEKHARWYYSESERKCTPFYYTGCGGNKNNFRSFEQCEERCPKIVAKDICEIPAEVGECQNYVARWYYDTSIARCRQFYWGGCGGNENNFAEENDCLNRCSTPEPERPEEPRQPEERPEQPGYENERSQEIPDRETSRKDTESCFMDPDPGLCDNYTARFYYNSHEGYCDVFAYGGCDGNNNNFADESECENLCGSAQNLCSLPPVYGRCSNNETRWYYDERARRCHEFDYSGCVGNKNNFASEDECMNYCDRQVEQPESERQPETEGSYDPEDFCNEPMAPGNCREDILSYYFNTETNACEAFYFTGCDGNRNRFETQEQCERQCGSYKGIDICREYPGDPGPCDQYQTRYFYDFNQRKCEPFNYGGCEGSGNRFVSYEECESICIERLEPSKPGDRAICFLPANSGNCTGSGEETRRWYYDDSRGSCVLFIYSGCAGNQNNFVSYESCVETCIIPDELPPSEEDNNIDNRCEHEIENCRTLRCPYGVRRSYDQSSLCEACQCENPCDGHECPEGSRCAIDVAGQDFVPVCRPENKPGECPYLSGDNTKCDRECYTDAECRGDYKCCQDGCGTRCVLPAVVEEPTEVPVTQPQPPLYPGDRQAHLEEKPQHEIDVSTPAGGVAILRCFATGYPPPTITWNFGSVTINTNQGRFILTSNGDLTIVQVHRSDTGTYLCVADNGLGEPVQREVNLEVERPADAEAYIAGPTNETIYVQLNQPAQLRCPAGGHPNPTVHWWRGKERINRHGDNYHIDDDNALIFRNVGLRDLGVYTCEGWNGQGRPVAIEKTLLTTTQIHTDDPEDAEYLKYVIQPAHAPTSKPVWPYRPHRPTTTRLPVVVVPMPARVPASAVIRRDPSNTYTAGSEIVLICDVDGVPAPNVTWFKNGVRIEAPSNKFEITETPNRLVIFDAQREDTGRYACEARNSFSYNRNEETITIESNVYVHPDCVDNPYFANCALIVKGNYCSNRYYSKFCCRSCTLAGQLDGHPNNL